MGQRMIFFSATGENTQAMKEAAKELGFEVIVSHESSGIWTLDSTIGDYLQAQRPNAAERNKETATALLNIGVTTFADLANKYMAEVWRAIAPLSRGRSFARIVHGARCVGAQFRDWHPQEKITLADVVDLAPLSKPALDRNGIDELDVLRHLAIQDVQGMKWLGDVLLPNVLHVWQRLQA